MCCGLKCMAKCQLFLRCKSNNKCSKATKNEEVHDGAMAGFLICVSETTNICEKFLLCCRKLGLSIGNPRKKRRKKGTTDQCFKTLLRPPAVLETEVKESNFTPDDGQAPKNDEGLLNDVRAGDSRHRLSFAIEAHGKEWNSKKSLRAGCGIRAKPFERLIDAELGHMSFRTNTTMGKLSHYSQSLSPLSESSSPSLSLSEVGVALASFSTFSPLFLPETTS